MKLTGLVVTHKIYGSGIITESFSKGVNTYIKVNFITEIKEFAFPGIFETDYMRFNDEQAQTLFKKEYGSKANLGQAVTETPNDNYLKEYNAIRQLKVYATRAAYNMRSRLTADLFTYYGAAAQPIYLACCDEFGWKSYLSGNFGRQKKLFAQNATPEGYDVWFLSNNNYTDTNNDNFTNKISDDLEYIYEKWTNNSLNMDAGLRRVVFVKTTNAKYVFIGIYTSVKVLRIDDGSRLRVFKRVSDVYPAEL